VSRGRRGDDEVGKPGSGGGGGEAGAAGRLRGRVERLDAYQRRSPWLGFPVAVGRKLSDDQGGQLAALVTYYGFLSLFPLLLLFRAILGYVLQGREDLQRDILNSALSNFPVIGDEIVRSQGRLRGSGLALAVGVVGALWAGLGVTQALQKAMDRVWGVPRRARPGPVAGRLRGLVLLFALGTATLVAAGLGGLSASSGLIGPGLRAATVCGSIAVNLGLFLVSFRVLTARSLGWGDVLPGAAVAAVGWAALVALGGWFVSHELQRASETYGAFAIVIGLLSWLYLSAPDCPLRRRGERGARHAALAPRPARAPHARRPPGASDVGGDGGHGGQRVHRGHLRGRSLGAGGSSSAVGAGRASAVAVDRARLWRDLCPSMTLSDQFTRSPGPDPRRTGPPRFVLPQFGIFAQTASPTSRGR
jgi:YihY family inner membrane protein